MTMRSMPSELHVEWLDVTTMDDAGRGITVMINNLTGERVEHNRLIEIEPIADEQGQLWRQFVKG